MDRSQNHRIYLGKQPGKSYLKPLLTSIESIQFLNTHRRIHHCNVTLCDTTFCNQEFPDHSSFSYLDLSLNPMNSTNSPALTKRTRKHSSRMCTVRSLPYRGVSLTETSLDRDPLDMGPPGQTPHG